MVVTLDGKEHIVLKVSFKFTHEQAKPDNLNSRLITVCVS